MPEPLNALGALGSSVSKEVLKPVGSAAEALTAPWVERLRRWAADRELERRLEDPNLPDAFVSYARRLAHHCAFISTVLRREPLPLDVVYEPLVLMSRNSEGENVDSTEWVTREAARTVVVDGAGMGKSTFVRRLIAQTLKDDDFVPVLLELRRIRDGDTLIEALSRQFDEINKPFDRDLLMKLFDVGRFLFVLDGLDEVPSERQEVLLAQIEELAKAAEQSAMLLTTRPETPLPRLAGARVVTIRPLSVEQAESLVGRYDTALGISVGRRMAAEFARIPSKLLETPLLVALLYRTYDYTKVVEPKISTFYEELYSALYKGHDLTKTFVRSKASDLDVASFRRLLRAFAFLVISHQKLSIHGDAEAVRLTEEAIRLTSVQPRSPAAFVDDLLLSVPLLVREGGELRFVHQSIAEWLAAEYLAIGNPEGDKMVTRVWGGPLHRRFMEVFDFLADVDPRMFERVVVRPFADEARSHTPAEPDKLLRSVSFWGDMEIAWWRPGRDLPAERSENVVALDWNLVGFRANRGKRTWMVLVRYRTIRGTLSPTIWQYMSEPQYLGVVPSSSDVVFRALKKVIPEHQWMSVLSPELRQTMRIREMRALVATSFAIANSLENPPVQLLSDSQIQRCGTAVEEDRAARDALMKLLSGAD
jgi:hypothetical protein